MRVASPVHWAALIFCVTGAANAGAVPFAVQLDPAQSSLTMQLCVSGQCDTEVSPVTGTFQIELDSVDQPAQVWLHDFHVYLQNTLHFSLSWGFLVAFNATGTGISLHYATPGVVTGPVAVTSDAFTFASVAGVQQGVLTYQATGVPCYALQANGRPCNDTHDLGADPATVGTWSGTITSANRIVTLVTSVDSTQPLDPNNPSLGSIHVTGTVRGTAVVPRPTGDVDGDGDVDAVDLSYFAAAMSGPGVTTPPAGVSAYHFAGSDLDQDGDVDVDDYAELQRARTVVWSL